MDGMREDINTSIGSATADKLRGEEIFERYVALGELLPPEAEKVIGKGKFNRFNEAVKYEMQKRGTGGGILGDIESGLAEKGIGSTRDGSMLTVGE